MNLGENIYRFRTQKNMSQGDLADALQVSRQSVSKWENNSAVPELDKLMKMAQLFGITLDALVTGEESAPPIADPSVPAQDAKSYYPETAFLSIPYFLIGILPFLFLPGHFLSWLIGIPALLAGFFVLFLGAKAYFEEKRNRPAPRPVSEPPTTAMRYPSMRQIWGIVLLVCAFLAFLLLTLFGNILIGLLYASPLYVPGLICLFAQKRIGLKCAWAEFVLIVTYFIWATGTNWYSILTYLRFFSQYGESIFNPMSLILSFVELVLLVCLIIWTVYSYRLDARPLGKHSILPVCLGAAVYFLTDLLPLTSDIIPIRLLSILHAGGIWLKVALFTVFLAHLWPTFRNWLKHRKDNKHSATPKTE